MRKNTQDIQMSKTTDDLYNDFLELAREAHKLAPKQMMLKPPVSVLYGFVYQKLKTRLGEHAAEEVVKKFEKMCSQKDDYPKSLILWLILFNDYLEQ